MNNDRVLEVIALEALRARITRVLPAQIKECLDQLDETQIWWRPNEQTNSVGNLTLHICGAVSHFLCRGVGGHEYVRDRPAEFAARALSKAQLLVTVAEMADKAEQTFARLDPSHLNNDSTEPAYYSTIFEDLFGVAIHLAVHTGQIVYVTKMLKEGSIDDLWSQTHRSLGAWRG
ncbi:MAG TPA: DUF1572 family protein [Pyrinomonadaceae bacterium]|nr:DUF1572 family protein [Pyrinomonadaceae bacterium]